MSETNQTEMGIISQEINVSGRFVRCFIYKPTDSLTLHLITTLTHEPDAFKEIPSSIELLRGAEGRNISRWDIAFIEGKQYKAEDAEMIAQQGISSDVQDPFFDPLSHEAFSLFRRSEKYQDLSTADAAAKYVAGWLAYARRHGHDLSVLDEHFRRVFQVYNFKQDYVDIITPYLQKLRSELGEEEYTTESISYFQELMRLVNARNTENIVDILKDFRGSVFVYCGANHKQAIDDAARILAST